MSYEKEQGLNQETFYTDRSYHTKDGPKYPDRNQKGRYTQQRPSNICFICRKEGCRSWKHPQKEQEESKARFKARNFSRFNGNSSDFEKRFDKTYTQYIITIEGSTESEDDLDSDFQALIVDTAKNETDDLIDNDTGQFLTEILTNQSCLHQLTTEAPVQEYDTEPQAIDSLVAGGQESRYDSKSFYGIVIDTGASKFSTAGYPQFQALQHENQSGSQNVSRSPISCGLITDERG